MKGERSSWQNKAARKVAQTWSKIPANWILSDEDLNRSKKEKRLTGSFIESFLEDEEVEIIQYGAADLVQTLQSRQYTSRTVTDAYCKTTAIAHQIVSQTVVYDCVHHTK